MKLIDKDALVAEIERLENSYDYALDYEAALVDMRNFLATLEAKEVDLEKEIEEHADCMPMSEFTHESEAEDFYEWAKKEFSYFYSLGLKSQKGE